MCSSVAERTLFKGALWYWTPIGCSYSHVTPFHPYRALFNFTLSLNLAFETTQRVSFSLLRHFVTFGGHRRVMNSPPPVKGGRDTAVKSGLPLEKRGGDVSERSADTPAIDPQGYDYLWAGAIDLHHYTTASIFDCLVFQVE